MTSNAVVGAEVATIYELRSGEVWLEHTYLYDEEDISNDSRGHGAAFLASHPLQPHELVRGCGVYHSSASAIEGSCRIFESADARDAAAATSGDSEDCPLMFCTSCWDPGSGLRITGAESAQGGNKRSSVANQSASKRRQGA